MHDVTILCMYLCICITLCSPLFASIAIFNHTTNYTTAILQLLLHITHYHYEYYHCYCYILRSMPLMTVPWIKP